MEDIPYKKFYRKVLESPSTNVCKFKLIPRLRIRNFAINISLLQRTTVRCFPSQVCQEL